MKRIAVIMGCAAVMFLASCQKELSSGDFTVYASHPMNDTVWTGSLAGSASVHGLRQLLAPVITVDSFNTTQDTTLFWGDSLEISFKAGSCVYANDPSPAGAVKLELYRLTTKADLIKAFKPTTSDGYLLEAASAFFVRVSKGEKELVLAPGSFFKIRFADKTEPKTNMQVFNGREGNPPPAASIIDTDFDWIRDTDSSWIRIFQKTGQAGVIKGYEMTVKNLRWVAAERYLDSTAAKSKLSVILSPNYTNKNTAVFAVLADHKTVVSLKADYSSRSFAAPNIPKGKKFKIITISRIADELYLGTKDVDDIGNTAAFSIKPEKKSLSDILQLLNSL